MKTFVYITFISILMLNIVSASTMSQEKQQEKANTLPDTTLEQEAQGLLNELNYWEQHYGISMKAKYEDYKVSGEVNARIRLLKEGLLEHGVVVSWDGEKYQVDREKSLITPSLDGISTGEQRDFLLKKLNFYEQHFGIPRKEKDKDYNIKDEIEKKIKEAKQKLKKLKVKVKWDGEKYVIVSQKKSDKPE